MLSVSTWTRRAKAVVFSFDEKTQCQALDRTQPRLPMKPGRGETMTHDCYKRNGTTDLFAALNVATGEVLYDTKPRHTGNDVLAFFKYIDLHVPRNFEIHVDIEFTLLGDGDLWFGSLRADLSSPKPAHDYDQSEDDGVDDPPSD